MKYRLIDILICPLCGSSFEVNIFQEKENSSTINTQHIRCQDHCHYQNLPLSSNTKVFNSRKCTECYTKEIIDGMLQCNQCNVKYPIIDGIPRILPNILKDNPDFLKKYKGLLSNILENDNVGLTKMMKKTKNAFAYEWLNDRLGFTGEAETLIGFFGKTGVDPHLYEIDYLGYEFHHSAQEIQYEPDGSFLQDKLILDVGCGMGRYMNIVNRFGGEVVGFDLSEAVEKARRDTLHNPFSHTLQADITNPPFKRQCFDFIYSIGVLHHTPDPRESFKCIVQLLKYAGTFSLCIYEKSNYWVKDFIERMIRKVTTKLPLSVLFYLSYIGVPHGWLLSKLRKNPVTFVLGSPLFLIKVCEHRDSKIRHTDTFDFYVAPYQWRYTKEEIAKWFEEEGFEDIQILPDNPICIKGLKRQK